MPIPLNAYAEKNKKGSKEITFEAFDISGSGGRI